MKGKGAFGEACAEKYLLTQGYQVVEKNFRTQYGEVDIIAQKDTYIVFVEVKARSSYNYGQPCESVNRRKQKRLTYAASTYLSEHTNFKQPRFDVVEVMTDTGFNRALSINHIQSAFDAYDMYSGGSYVWA